MDGNALGDLDGVEILGVHSLGQRLLNLALFLSLCSLALALLLALLTTTGGLARGLLDGGTSLLEHLLAAVLLGLASHAAVVVLFVVVTALALLALALLVGVGEVHAGSDVIAGIGAMAMGTVRSYCRRRCDRYDGHRDGRCCRHDGCRARQRARPWPSPRRPSSP